MKSILLKTLLFYFFFILSNSHAEGQVIFWTDDFNGTGPTSGDRDAPNHADGDNGSSTSICGLGDYSFRTNLSNDASNGLSVTFTSFSGSYWRGEHLSSCQGNPEVINFTGISTIGLSNFQFTGSFGAASSTTWEPVDNITVEYSFDGAPFSRGLSFECDQSANGGSNGRLAQDTDGNGVGDGTTLTANLTSFAFNIPGTGSNLSIRVIIMSDQGGEEFAFDNFMLAHSSVVPVELMDFKANLVREAVNLHWTTATEINNQGFDIQHSTNGRDWKDVGFVNGMGNTTATTDYQFTHQKTTNGMNYYRLKQLDQGDDFEYSNVVSLEVVRSQKVIITPNPIKNGTFSLSHPDLSLENATLRIFNSVGQLVQTSILESDASLIRTEELAKGLYFFQVDLGGQEDIVKVIIE